ncbi:unnamed protein product, partial [Rotaria magnacalcarata]
IFQSIKHTGIFIDPVSQLIQLNKNQLVLHHQSIETKQISRLSYDTLGISILYSYKCRFLGLQSELCDKAHYFIDGDSLIISVAHHINNDLITHH